MNSSAGPATCLLGKSSERKDAPWGVGGRRWCGRVPACIVNDALTKENNESRERGLTHSAADRLLPPPPSHEVASRSMRLLRLSVSVVETFIGGGEGEGGGKVVETVVCVHINKNVYIYRTV